MNSFARRVVSRLTRGAEYAPVRVALNEVLLPEFVRMGRKDDEDMRRIIRYVLKEDSNCIDVGAHLGAVTAEFVEAAPLGHHYAFEPLPHMASELKDKFPGVEVIEAALSDCEGQAEFVYNVSHPAYSGLRKREYDFPPSELRTIKVPLRMLDEMLPPDLSIHLIKIDVEGAEYQVIKGALRTIKTSKPYIVFEHGRSGSDCYGTTPSMVYTLLVGEGGLRIFLMDGSGPLSEASFIQIFEQGKAFNFLARP